MFLYQKKKKKCIIRRLVNTYMYRYANDYVSYLKYAQICLKSSLCMMLELKGLSHRHIRERIAQNRCLISNFGKSTKHYKTFSKLFFITQWSENQFNECRCSRCFFFPHEEKQFKEQVSELYCLVRYQILHNLCARSSFAQRNCINVSVLFRFYIKLSELSFHQNCHIQANGLNLWLRA